MFGGVYKGYVWRDWTANEILFHILYKQSVEWECVSACAHLNFFFCTLLATGGTCALLICSFM